MKRKKLARIPLLVVIVIAVLLLTACPNPNPPAPDLDNWVGEVTFTSSVKANSPWLNTASVKPGDVIDIQVVTGTWRIGGGAQGENNHTTGVGLEGQYHGGAPLPDAPLGALLGRIGNDKPFFIGEELVVIAREAGKLAFRINDTWFGDNIGALDLQVEIQRPGDNQLNNGAFSQELEGWEIQRDENCDECWIEVRSDEAGYPHYLAWEKPQNGEVGASIWAIQTLNLDVTYCTDLTLYLDLRVDRHPQSTPSWWSELWANTEEGMPEYPVKLRMTFTNKEGESIEWSHGFLYNDEGTRFKNYTLVPRGEWTSLQLDIFGSQWRDEEGKGMVRVPAPVTLNAIYVGGDGLNFAGAVANLRLVGCQQRDEVTSDSPDKEGETIIPVSLQPSTALHPDAIRIENIDRVTQLERFGKGTIEEIAYAPDGQTLAVATTLGVYVYDIQTLTELDFIQTKTPVLSLAFSPDGSMLALGLRNRPAELRRASDGALLRTIEAESPANWVTSLAFSTDGEMLASARYNGEEVHLWRVSDGTLLRTLEGHAEDITAVAFSPDRTILASAAEDKTVRLWRLRSGQLLHTLETESIVNNLIFTPTGEHLVSHSNWGVAVWQVQSGMSLHRWDTSMRGVMVLPSGEIIAARLWEDSLQLIAISDSAELSTLGANLTAAYHIAFSPGGHTLAAVDQDAVLHLWRVEDGADLGIQKGFKNWMGQIAFSPDGKILAVATGGTSVNLYQLEDLTLLQTLESSPEDVPDSERYRKEVWSLAFSPDGEILAAGVDDGSVILWRLDESAPFYTLTGPTGSVNSLAFSPNGRILAASAHSDIVWLWWVVEDTPQGFGSLLGTLQAPTEAVEQVIFSPDGQYLAANARTIRSLLYSMVRLWRVYDGALLWEQHHGGNPLDIAFSPDGQFLAVQQDYEGVGLCQVSSGKGVGGLAHSWNTESVAFAQDGRLVAVGTVDGEVQLWKLAADENGSIESTLLITLEGHTHLVRILAFSPDGRILASSALDGTILLWGVR
jgi:WD40 repeat protein